MASAKNKVVAGDYKGWIVSGFAAVGIYLYPSVTQSFLGDGVKLDKFKVESFELMTEEKVKSGASAIFRGAVGVAILGPVGILAGLTAKSKGIYNVAIQGRKEIPIGS